MRKVSGCIGVLCTFFVVGTTVQATPSNATLSKSVAPKTIAPTKAAPFAFRDGDRVVFLGDSITAFRLYTTYTETFLLTRFPNWKLQFRNAGRGGAKATDVSDAALQRDVLSFRPTVVTIDFGMNDGDYSDFKQEGYDAHIKAETAIVTRLQAAKVRPIILSASPVEEGSPGDAAKGYNQTLAKFAQGDAEIAAKANVPFVDQLHPYINAINRLRAIDSKLRISSDTIHPSATGGLLMANFILTGLNAPSLVSSATIDARRGTVTQSDGAQITNIARNADGISFNRLDKSLLFPIDVAARPALQLVALADNLNRYIVQVTHLKLGLYEIFVNEKKVTRCSSEQLANGVNLGSFDSPLSETGAKIMEHVRAKNEPYIAPQKVADEERLINDLRRPARFQFAIKRVVASTPR